MYLDFFDFLRHPFHASPDLELFFSSPSHKEALAAIARGTGRDPGFVAIFGEAGVGKTAVLHSYLAGSSLDDESTPVVIHNPELSFRELVKTIYEQRGWDFPAAARLPGLVTDFKSRLIEEFEGGRNVVVLIDEAHRMPAETLEKLGLFLDLVSSREKALQIVLFGRPELEEVLSGSEQIITRQIGRASCRERV
jgi:type II secretory pathway predicted ATPase ExeA